MADEHLKWARSDERFEFSNDLYISGDIIVGQSGMFGNDIYVNYDGPEGHSRVNFFRQGSPDGAYLEYQDGDDRFVLSRGMVANYFRAMPAWDAEETARGHILGNLANVFTYDDLYFTEYGMGVYNPSLPEGGREAAGLVFMAGYLGLKFFTENTERMYINQAGNTHMHGELVADQDIETSGHFIDADGQIDSGSTFRFIANGAYIVDTDVDGAWILDSTRTITAIWLHRGQAGSSGNTILDVHKNGTTLYTTQGNRPTIAFNDGDNKVDCTLPDVTSLEAGDIITLDIDAVEAGEPADCSLIIHVR